jgi:UMF1 family MFS transporter
MYDWANSVYALTITSAIFPIYYQAVAINAQGGDRILFFGKEIVNSVLYSYSLSFSFLLVALILPLLSGIADYTGNKKFFLKVFMYIGSISCIGLFFFTGKNIEWGILCSVFASVGYSGSTIFYDAFLNEIVTEDRRDMVSARGYSYGYIGGVVLLIANLVVIQFYPQFGIPSESLASRIAFLTVGFWWIGFSLYALSKLPENHSGKRPEGKYLLNGYRELRHVWHQLRELELMKKFLLAFFFYNMGVQTVMYLAATFGAKELNLASSELIITILLIQFVAIIGSYLFASVSQRRGNIFSLMTMILIWIGCCLYAYTVTSANQFYLLAFVVGMVMGGIQSLSRATFSKLIPAYSKDNASFFSFYDVTLNISIVFGTFTYGLVEQITGSMRTSTLVLATLFIVGGIFLLQVKKLHATT